MSAEQQDSQKVVDMSDAYNTTPIVVSKDGLLVNINNFEEDRVVFDVPGKAEVGEIVYWSVKIQYKYPRLKEDGTMGERIAPLKIELPKSYSLYGISRKEIEGNVSYSIGFTIDMNSEWGKSFADLLEKVYICLLKDRINRNSLYSTITDNKYNKIKLPKLKEGKNWAVSAWTGCEYPIDFKDEGGVINPGYNPTFYSKVIKSGRYASKFLTVHKSGDPAKPIVKSLSWDYITQFSITGVPCIMFRDYFMGTKTKFRLSCVSVIVKDVQPKDSAVEQIDTITKTHEELLQKQNDELKQQLELLRSNFGATIEPIYPDDPRDRKNEKTNTNSKSGGGNNNKGASKPKPKRAADESPEESQEEEEEHKAPVSKRGGKRPIAPPPRDTRNKSSNKGLADSDEASA